MTITPDRFARGNSRLGASLPVTTAPPSTRSATMAGRCIQPTPHQTTTPRRRPGGFGQGPDRPAVPVRGVHRDARQRRRSRAHRHCCRRLLATALDRRMRCRRMRFAHARCFTSWSTCRPCSAWTTTGLSRRHGVIDAATLAHDGRRSRTQLPSTPNQQADRQPTRVHPSKKLINLVRQELCCTFPWLQLPGLESRHRPHHPSTTATPPAVKQSSPTSNHSAASTTASRRSRAGRTTKTTQATAGSNPHRPRVPRRLLHWPHPVPWPHPTPRPRPPRPSILDTARQKRITKLADDQRKWDEANLPPF